MTESEWRSSTDVAAMLEFLRDRGATSERKHRLFAVACCLRIWDILKDERSRRAVHVAERFADGAATEDERARAEDEANDVWNEFAYSEAETDAATDAAEAACSAASDGEAEWSSRCAAHALSYDGRQEAERAAQAALLRCIFGGPLSPAAFDPSWRTGTTASLATKMYETRDFLLMPVLGDALQDAGCNDDDLLNHCRSGGVHVRGCHVVDFVLGRS